MKKFILRTVDKDGNLIKESELEVKEKSILIQQLIENVRYDEAQRVHDQLREVLLDYNNTVITLHPYVRLQVLNIVE